MNTYQSIVGKVNYGLFLVSAFLLPFPQAALRLSCVLWVISWAMEGRWLSKPRSLKANRMAIPFILFAIWYGWQLLSVLWAPNYPAWSSQMERYMAFGLLLPVGLWGVNDHYDWRQAGRVWVYGCIAAAVFYPAILTLLCYHREIIDAVHWVAPWNYSTTDWWPFYQDNFSNIKHRLFFCSTEMLGIIIATQIWRDKKRVLRILLPIMLLLIVLTGSRQAILMLAAVGAVALVYRMPKPYRLRYGVGVLLLGIAVGAGVLALHPRMQEIDVKHDARVTIWRAALQQPSAYIWTGLGAGQSNQYISERFEEQHIQLEHKDYHPHNQYLKETMELGLGGMLLFVAALLAIPLCAQGIGRKTAVMLTTVLMVNMMTDCMFALYCGVALWAVGMVFILLQSNAQRDEQAARDTQAH